MMTWVTDSTGAPAGALPRRVLRSSRRKWSLVFAGSLAFTAIGVWMVADGTLVGWFVLVFFGLCALVSVVMLLRPARLELSAESMTLLHLGRRTSYEWSRCGPFFVGEGMVLFDYDLDRPPSIGERLAVAVAGARGGLPDTYGMTPDELAGLLNHYRAAAQSNRAS